MDPIGLRAISTKPAARMYKWVGGQSITTGLRAFDGWLSDAEQTPAGFEPWFTEPLLRLPHG
jgi:predicted O-linked N-acetylglucosamine transferase (SPINDLY family)